MGRWLQYTILVTAYITRPDLPQSPARDSSPHASRAQSTNDLTMSSERCKTHRVRLPLATLPLLLLSWSLLSGGLT